MKLTISINTAAAFLHYVFHDGSAMVLKTQNMN